MNGEADENDKKRAENLRVMMDAEKRKALSFFDDPAAAMAAGVAQSAADDLIHNAMVASKGKVRPISRHMMPLISPGAVRLHSLNPCPALPVLD